MGDSALWVPQCWQHDRHGSLPHSTLFQPLAKAHARNLEWPLLSVRHEPAGETLPVANSRNASGAKENGSPKISVAAQHYDKVAKERLAQAGDAPPAPGLHHLRIDSAEGQAYLQVPCSL